MSREIAIYTKGLEEKETCSYFTDIIIIKLIVEF